MSSSKPSFGYVTKRLAEMYFSAVDLDPDDPANKVVLRAPKDSEHLHFWQLYAELGADAIQKLVRKFYERVYAHEDAWFRSSFTDVAPFEHAVWAQSMYWIDAFGGGSAYHGGQFRASWHHGRVRHVMNEKGGKLWMSVMRQTLDEDLPSLTSDPRVRPAIDTFLRVSMRKYAKEFHFSDTDVMSKEEIQAPNTKKAQKKKKKKQKQKQKKPEMQQQDDDTGDTESTSASTSSSSSSSAGDDELGGRFKYSTMPSSSSPSSPVDENTSDTEAKHCQGDDSD